MNKEEELLRKKSPVQIKNKKASFEYFFMETFTAGIVLTGTEIKSIRMGKASLVDTFCFINNGEIWVKGMNISPYFYGSYNNHEAKRDRKLLLNKREIHKLQEATKQIGYTIVPTLVPMESEMKQAAMKRPGIIMLSGRTLNVKFTVSSIHPAVLAEFAKAPAIMNIHAISMMSFAPAPMQKESILCLKALPLDTAIAYMQAVMKAIVIGIL